MLQFIYKAKLETKALKAKRPGFTDERYNETSYYHEPENSKFFYQHQYFLIIAFNKIHFFILPNYIKLRM